MRCYCCYTSRISTTIKRTHTIRVKEGKNGTATVENCVARPQKIKNRITIRSSNSTVSKELKAGSQNDICPSMFIAALFTVAKRGSDPSVHQWMNGFRKCSLYTMKHYSTLKRREIPTDATPWVNLEDIMVHEIKQSQKDRHCVTPLV